MRVEWDPEKDHANRTKHSLGFDEVQVLFEGDADYLLIYDEDHSSDEDRFLAIGPIARGIVAVAHTEPRDDVIRIISARMATRTEEELFYRPPEATSDEGRDQGTYRCRFRSSDSSTTP